MLWWPAIRSPAATTSDRSRVEPRAGPCRCGFGRWCRCAITGLPRATVQTANRHLVVGHLIDGRSVTDAAHLAGFADGSHANKVCWEMTGAAPHEFAQAVRETQI